MLSAKGQQPWAQLWVSLWVPTRPVCAVTQCHAGLQGSAAAWGVIWVSSLQAFPAARGKCKENYQIFTWLDKLSICS